MILHPDKDFMFDCNFDGIGQPRSIAIATRLSKHVNVLSTNTTKHTFKLTSRTHNEAEQLFVAEKLFVNSQLSQRTQRIATRVLCFSRIAVWCWRDWRHHCWRDWNPCAITQQLWPHFSLRGLLCWWILFYGFYRFGNVLLTNTTKHTFKLTSRAHNEAEQLFVIEQLFVN